MSGTATIWITAGFTAFATLAAVLVSGWIARNNQASHHDREMRVAAYAEVLRRSVEVHDRFVGAWSTDETLNHGWSEWNQAIAMVALVATKPVAAASSEMDAVYWRYARPRGREGVSWDAARKQLDEVRTSFVNAARFELQRTKAKLDGVGGRPPAGDPIWHADED
jgi:hypothetical protein